MALIGPKTWMESSTQFGGTNSYDSSTPLSYTQQVLYSSTDPQNGEGSQVKLTPYLTAVGAYLDDDTATNSGAVYLCSTYYNLLIKKIKASDPQTSDYFGEQVAMGSGRIVVGVANDDSYTGSVHLYNYSGNHLLKIRSPTITANQQFGRCVAIGAGRIIVGSMPTGTAGTGYTGSVYMYDLHGNYIQKITFASSVTAGFGSSIAIGNNRIIISETYYNTYAGRIHIYDINGNPLSIISPPDPSTGDEYGTRVSIGNGRIVVTSPKDDDNGSNSGSAYIYDINGTYISKIKPSDGAANENFGLSSAVVGGGRIIIGSSGNLGSNGAAYLFDLNGTQLYKYSTSYTATYFGHDADYSNGKIAISGYGSSIWRGAHQYSTPRQDDLVDSWDNKI